MIERLESKDWLKFNAMLQQKKSNVRETLKEKGVLQRKGKNDFDKYRYFSEAQYKELFTALLADEGLELSVNVENIQMYEGTAKQPYGRIASIKYTLTDIDTGFYESAVVPGDGMDKGDKGLYKAYTGSLKYYLANTFMVATGDDPEVPDKSVEKKITKAKAKTLGQLIKDFGVAEKTVLEEYEHKSLEDFTEGEYANCLKRLDATRRQEVKNE